MERNWVKRKKIYEDIIYEDIIYETFRKIAKTTITELMFEMLLDPRL